MGTLELMDVNLASSVSETSSACKTHSFSIEDLGVFTEKNCKFNSLRSTLRAILHTDCSIRVDFLHIKIGGVSFPSHYYVIKLGQTI